MADPVDVYLDVDGVLNAVNRQKPEWDWTEPAQRTGVLGFPICWSTELIDRVNALAARPDVHFHWLTTWLTDAPNRLCSAIGLNGQDWPVLGETEHKTVEDGWWKLPAARAALAVSGRRLVWVDDDLAYDTNGRTWLGTLGDRALGVSPDPRVGLTDVLMGSIEQWIDHGTVPDAGVGQ